MDLWPPFNDPGLPAKHGAEESWNVCPVAKENTQRLMGTRNSAVCSAPIAFRKSEARTGGEPGTLSGRRDLQSFRELVGAAPGDRSAEPDSAYGLHSIIPGHHRGARAPSGKQVMPERFGRWHAVRPLTSTIVGFPVPTGPSRRPSCPTAVRHGPNRGARPL